MRNQGPWFVRVYVQERQRSACRDSAWRGQPWAVWPALFDVQATSQRLSSFFRSAAEIVQVLYSKAKAHPHLHMQQQP